MHRLVPDLRELTGGAPGDRLVWDLRELTGGTPGDRIVPDLRELTSGAPGDALRVSRESPDRKDSSVIKAAFCLDGEAWGS